MEGGLRGLEKKTKDKTLAYSAMFDRAGPLYLLLDLFGRQFSFWVVLIIELTSRSNGDNPGILIWVQQ